MPKMTGSHRKPRPVPSRARTCGSRGRQPRSGAQPAGNGPARRGADNRAGACSRPPLVGSRLTGPSVRLAQSPTDSRRRLLRRGLRSLGKRLGERVAQTDGAVEDRLARARIGIAREIAEALELHRRVGIARRRSPAPACAPVSTSSESGLRSAAKLATSGDRAAEQRIDRAAPRPAPRRPPRPSAASP